MRWAALDELIGLLTTDTADVRAAREHYSQKTGRVHDEHELFAERSDAFVEWYVAERRGPGGQTPLQRVLRGDLPEALRPAALALSRSYRSLFVVTALGGHQRARRLPPLEAQAQGRRDDTPSLSFIRRGDGLRLRDLLGGGVFEVDERRRLPGVNVGDIFEARLAPDLDEPPRLLFTRTFLCHPREASEPLLQQAQGARRAGEDREAVLFRLQRLRLRCTAYRHVPAARIYAQPDAPP